MIFLCCFKAVLIHLFNKGKGVKSNRNFLYNLFERYHDTIEAYDPVRDVWENVGEMASSRSWLSCVPLMVSILLMWKANQAEVYVTMSPILHKK